MIQTYDLHDLRRFTHGRGRLRGLHRRLTAADFRRFWYTAADTDAYAAGTTVTWSDTTGTLAMTLNNLAAGAARVGAKITSSLIAVPPGGVTNAVLPDYLLITLVVQFTSAPAAGGPVSVSLSFSNSGTAGTANAGFAAASGGTDALLGNVDQLPQMVFAGALIASNALGGSANQRAYLATVPPLDAYYSPVVYNNASVNLKASNDVSVLSITPYWRQRAT